MSPFDDACVNRPSGMALSEGDRFVLETLFHPFSVLFGYRENDQDQFNRDLKQTRIVLAGLLDCEKKIIEQTGADEIKFHKHADYLLLRAALTDRLDVLEEFGTYPHMLKPLDIERSNAPDDIVKHSKKLSTPE